MLGNIRTPGRVGMALVRAARAMITHETPRDAGSIAYFSLIALFPSILVLIALVHAFLGWPDWTRLLGERIADLFPGSRAFLTANLAEITEPSPALLLSSAFAVLWLSTWIFTSMENALNRAWKVPMRRSFWESRLRSITLMILGGMLLLVSTGIAAVVSALRWRATDRVPAFAQDQIINWLWSSVLLAFGFLIAIVVFSCVYKLMPDRKVLWREAISGAVVAAALWETGSMIFARLLPAFDWGKVYGRTGVFIALLVWVYTSTLIMLYGANFSAQLHLPFEELGRTEKPSPGGDTRQEKTAKARIRPFPLNR